MSDEPAKIGIQFSGGKDSLATLYLSRPVFSQATVYFGDTGMIYPHMVDFVHRTCEKLGARLKVISPPTPIASFHATNGLPTDLLPVEATPEMALFTKPDHHPVKLQSSLSCCGNMLWMPLHNAMIEDGINIVVRGTKAADHHVGAPDGHVDERGVRYISPIWNWTDEKVFGYLREIGAEVPKHYGAVNNSFDCILCTAFLTHPGARERLAYTKRHYPDQWRKLDSRLRTVRHIIDKERHKLDDAFSLCDEPELVAQLAVQVRT